MIAQPHEVQVRRDEDQRASAGRVLAAADLLDQGRQHGGGEVLEARVGVLGRREAVKPCERLLWRHGERDFGYRAGVHRCRFDFARDILHVGGEDRMNLRRHVRRRDHYLPHVSRLVVQVPGPDAAEVASMPLFRLLVELL